MSKAFTRESDDRTADEIAPVRPQPLPGAKNYMTRQGADRLRLQIDELLEQRRVLLGASGGGEAQPSLPRIEFELQRLQRTLQSVVVVEPPADKEKVALGASVLVRDQEGDEETYQIVGMDEADPGAGRISSASPLAQALIKGKAGDKVRFKSPAGDQELTILDVRY